MLNFLIFMLASTLRMGTPIALTALGGLTSERSGVVNIGLEGIMLASAFGAVLGSYLTGNPWIGVLTAILVGVLISAIHSVISITWGGNQSVSQFHGAGAPCNRIFRCGTEGGLWAAGQLSAGSEPGAYADSFVDSGGGRIFIRFVPLRVYRVSGADSDSLYV